MAAPSSRQVVYKYPKKSISKEIITIGGPVNANSQADQNVFNAAFPCTVGAIRLDISTDAVTPLYYVVMVLRDSQALPSINISPGQPTITPEKDVFSCGIVETNTSLYTISIKTKRKMQLGDSLMVMFYNDSGSALNVKGVCQFFIWV